MCQCRCCRGVCGCGEKLTLVSYQILFTKRGLEVAFPSRQELVEGCLCASSFATWKIAEFVQRLHHLPLPAKWARNGYPPAARDGLVVALPPSDGKYLRVQCQVQECWVREPFRFEETQVEALEEISDAIRSMRPPDWRGVRLPAGGLAAPLDPLKSRFGDKFLHFPDTLGASPPRGKTLLNGWLKVEFDEPEGDFASFKLEYSGVGTPSEAVFGSGARYRMEGNQAFSASVLPNGKPVVSGGRLNLKTGEAEDVQVHATFRNSVIAEIDKLNRIPFGFPFDYPPLIPFRQLSAEEAPKAYAKVEFRYAADGSIQGLRLSSKTVSPLPLLPFSGLFPPFSFGPEGVFFFANPNQRPSGSPADNPDGIPLDPKSLLHSGLVLETEQMQEAPRQAACLPCLPQPVAEGALAQAGGRLYLMGGVAAGRPSRRVWVYDPSDGLWTEGPPLLQATASAQAAAHGNHIFLAGGWIESDGTRILSGALQILNIRTGEWRLASESPQPVAEGASLALKGEIYVLGGFIPNRIGRPVPGGAVQVYNPTTGIWRQGEPAPAPAAGAAAASSGASIYLAGGRIRRNLVSNQTQVYDTAKDIWSPGPPLKIGVYGVGGGLIGRRFHLVGGREKPDGHTTGRTQLLDLESGSWQLGADEPVPTGSSAVAVLEGRLCVAGGWTRADALQGRQDQETGAVQVFSPAEGWSVCGDQPLFSSADVLNAAALTADRGAKGNWHCALSPGCRAVLAGRNLASESASVPPGEQMGGVSIQVAGCPAKICSTAPDKIEFQIPQGIEVNAKGEMFLMELHRKDVSQQAPPVRLPLLPAAPGIFVYSFGTLREPGFLDNAAAVSCNQDGSFNCASQPARPGEYVSVYVTGLGAKKLKPRRILLQLSSGTARRRPLILAERALPGQPGIKRLDFRIPSDLELRSNNMAVIVSVNGIRSNQAFISVDGKAERLPKPLPCGKGRAFVLPRP